LRGLRAHRYGGLTPIRRKEPSVFYNNKSIQNDAIAFTKTAGFVGVFTA
jgi:hypothetical protein